MKKFARAAWLVENGFAPSLPAAYRMLREDRVPGAFRVGRQFLISIEDFEAGVRAAAGTPSEALPGQRGEGLTHAANGA